MEDICWLGTDNFEESIKLHMFLAVPLSFGCETEETGLIANQYADGMKHRFLLPYCHHSTLFNSFPDIYRNYGSFHGRK